MTKREDLINRILRWHEDAQSYHKNPLLFSEFYRDLDRYVSASKDEAINIVLERCDDSFLEKWINKISLEEVEMCKEMNGI